MPEIDEFDKRADRITGLCCSGGNDGGTYYDTLDLNRHIAKALREVHDMAIERCAKVVDDGDAHCGLYDCCRNEHELNLAKAIRRLKKSNG